MIDLSRVSPRVAIAVTLVMFTIIVLGFVGAWLGPPVPDDMRASFEYMERAAGILGGTGLGFALFLYFLRAPLARVVEASLASMLPTLLALLLLVMLNK